jgi:hypothetical protein
MQCLPVLLSQLSYGIRTVWFDRLSSAGDVVVVNGEL